jgi:hypothetical protein
LFVIAGPKFRQGKAVQVETRVERDMVSSIVEAPYAPLFANSNKWGRPPMHIQRLKHICDTLLSKLAVNFDLRRYVKAAL